MLSLGLRLIRSLPLTHCQLQHAEQPIAPSRAYQAKTMTSEEYEKLPATDQEHFMLCPDCRELFDLRSDEDVVFHLAHHKPQRPAFRIPESGRILG